ncbi:hypothetical protein GLAREA_12172 [Glarea lozoyensis ATCC 20868]|uniref:Heterokaryon incompatibility domain-containing protein n=1 Tax=Glarea lozoyensis (strain ATCC 20868 / MF5171) TaxID=1116229 RepID=S3D2N4_GLAL2|nr:uncharacterized protein GLAREA_12172 [Glarea lozoyensis ATCC 20868]EPE32090.1 hypothetical protein GLAREA_12172 [Glarea lozoyensis ATCC 20868]
MPPYAKQCLDTGYKDSTETSYKLILIMNLHPIPLTAAASTHKHYEYMPLETTDTVRILVLRPSATFGDPIYCNIIHRRRHHLILNSTGGEHYEAVSYTWGNGGFTYTLFCNTGASILAITENLDSLLRYFRKQKSVRYLWIDVICLNQDDDIEKSIQVGLMGEIYQQARRVCIWLGQPFSEFEVSFCFGFLKRVAALKKRQVTAEVVREISKEVFDTDDWLERISKLLSREWFHRRWIIQEAALGHDTIVYCGLCRISWQWFADGLLKLKCRFEELHTGQLSKPLHALRNVINLYSNADNMLRLLWDFHSTECRDEQDRIFALTSLAEDIQQTSHEGNQRTLALIYSKDWVAIYIRFAQNCIEIGEADELLRHLFALGSLSKSQNDMSIPSYVPDWSKRREESSFDYIPANLKVYYSRLQGLPNFDDITQGADQYFVVGATSVSWPPRDFFVQKHHLIRHEICRLLAYSVLDGFLSPKGLVREEMSNALCDSEKNLKSAWIELSEQILNKSGLVTSDNPHYHNTLFLWLRNVMNNYTLFTNNLCLPNMAEKDPSSKLYMAIGKENVEAGDICVKICTVERFRQVGSTRSSDESVFFSPWLGIVVRKNETELGRNLENTRMDSEESHGVSENWRIITPCVILTSLLRWRSHLPCEEDKKNKG